MAAVGTGASAIQFVPAIQPNVAALHVFQRTPPWVVPHTNRRISDAERRLYRRVPALQKAIRAGVYAGREALVLGFVKNPRLMGVPERLSRRHMREQISDPELLRARDAGLHDRLQADPAVQPLVSRARRSRTSSWSPAAVREVRARSIVAADGSERAVDTIIFGTGFRVADMPIGEWVRGRDGKRLADTWEGSPRAHLGCTVAGFPNLFLLLGPNTGLGHNSMVYMIESQLNHVVDALRVMRERGAAVAEVRPEVQQEYNRELDARMAGTVWSTGCSSWYLDETGRNATLWPDWTWRFRLRTRRFDPAQHTLRAATTGRERVAA